MPRTPLANQVQEWMSVAQEATQRKVSTEQVLRCISPETKRLSCRCVRSI